MKIPPTKWPLSEEESLYMAEEILAEYMKIRLGAKTVYGQKAQVVGTQAKYDFALLNGWIAGSLYSAKDGVLWFTSRCRITRDDCCTTAKNKQPGRIAAGPLLGTDMVQRLAQLLRRTASRWGKIDRSFINPKNNKRLIITQSQYTTPNSPNCPVQSY